MSIYRLNLMASWDRNIDPANKVASVAATYGRDSGKPSHLSFRLFFWNEAHARRWLKDRGLLSVGGRLFPLTCTNERKLREDVQQFKLDFDLSSKLPGSIVNGKAVARYSRLMEACRRGGYRIGWQAPNYIPRCYPTQDEFERVILDGIRPNLSKHAAVSSSETASKHWTDARAED